MAKRGPASTAPQVRIGFLPEGAHPGSVAGKGYTFTWKPIYCAGYDIAENGERQYHHFTSKECDCKPGPHWEAVTRGHLADETALVGGRGGGKSEDGLPWLIMGDTASGGRPYIENKFYKALVLRRNAKDLHDWFGRGREFFGMLGARAVESPTMKFVFPSGAEIICDHLADEGSYQKYQGHEYARVLIEECPQIPTQKLYENLRRSNRVKPNLGMQARILVLANPDGPGLGWFIKRFIKLRHSLERVDFSKLTPEQKIAYIAKYPNGPAVKSGEVWTGKGGQTRMFIHSTVYDNPYYLVGNADYAKQLENIEDENEKRRWLMGDFTALAGQYFPTFRPDGPMPGEPSNARHVHAESSLKIEPWWPRIMGMDIGYRHHAAVYKAAIAPDGRLIVYDELVEAEVDNEEWGMRVAKWCKAEFPHLPSRSIPLFLSHEAFGNRGEGRTQAEQLAAGIRMVLGGASGLIFGADDPERSDPAGVTDDHFFRLLSDRQQPRIVIRQPFSRKRVDGWSFIRILMKWTGATPLDPKLLNQDHLRRLAESGDTDAINEYLQSFQVDHGQVLPRLVISDRCRLLIAALPTLVYDTDGKNPEDVRKTETIEDDIADAFRYLCVGYRKCAERIPRSVVAQRAREEAERSGVPDAWMYHHMAMVGEEYDQQQGAEGSFFYGLGSSRLTGVKRLQ